MVNQFSNLTDLFEEVCLLFSTIMTGNHEGEHLILHLLEGTGIVAEGMHTMYWSLYHTFCSHLNSLVPQLNKVAREHFIENLRSRADGETVVDMAKEFGNATLEVISTVRRIIFDYCTLRYVRRWHLEWTFLITNIFSHLLVAMNLLTSWAILLKELWRWSEIHW